MAEPFDVAKMISGPLTPVFWIKTILFGLGLAFLGMVGWAFYVAYFAPEDPTTTQNNRAREIIYYYPEPRATFGCSSVRINHQPPLTNRIKK